MLASFRLVSLTLLTLVAFAANSVLCRLALDVHHMDPMTFTAIRLASGAVILALMLLAKQPAALGSITHFGSHRGALYLFVYAVGFAYAYVTLPTATGALILFAAVQFTMLFLARLAGNRMIKLEALGTVISLSSFAYFVLPDLASPNALGLIVMAVAGVAWGLYSRAGANSADALLDTGANFIRCFPFALLLLFFIPVTELSVTAVYCALASGVLASGLGYALWYQVLPLLDNSVAAVCQLSVPLIAAFGGVLFVAEPLSLHLIISAAGILGGMLLVIIAKSRRYR
ncbi:MAG: drug/metabolite transporter (DMT)-like permease [Paraglaciecola sp.]|jgi:drug/metabolite transporter (DMT)-like permease